MHRNRARYPIHSAPRSAILPTLLRTLLAGLLLGPWASAALLADEPAPPCHGQAAASTAGSDLPSAPAAETLRDLQIPATPLLDQRGETVRFGPDLVDGKVVAINFVFTTCTTVCPPMGANFGKLQSLLGERAGRDVHLVSVSIDPAVDTPQRLAAWGQRFGAGDAWTLVTGDKPRVDELLQKLGVFVADKQFHAPIVLLGNAQTGEWRRANGLTPAAQLLAQIDALAPSSELAHSHSAAISAPDESAVETALVGEVER